MKNSLKQNISCRLPMLVFVYCLMQPVMDVITYWQNVLGIGNGITTFLRLGLLGISVLLGFVLSERRGVYWAMFAVLGGFAAMHILSCSQAGYTGVFDDLSNLLRIMMLPLTALCFCTFLKANTKVFPAVLKGIAVNLAVILAVMVLSRLTGTDPYTYSNKSIGVRGWFYNASSQSAILGMIVPVALAWVLNRWPAQVLPGAAAAVLGLGALYAFGTRLAFMSMVAGGLGIGVCLLIVDRRRWKQAAAVALITAVLTAAVPLSPMVRNQRQMEDNFDIKQQVFDNAAEESLEAAYDLFVPGLIARFGAARTLEAYGYSTDVDVVGDARLMKLTFCRLLLEDSPGLSGWFGLSRGELYQQARVTDVLNGGTEEKRLCFDPENDFHGIYYLCGGVGLVLMATFLAYFALRAFAAMFRSFRRVFTLEFCGAAIGCCVAVVSCVFSGSILRFNSASVYLAVLLAVLWHLSAQDGEAAPAKINLYKID